MRGIIKNLSQNFKGGCLFAILVGYYVVKLELPELRDMISLLRRTSNNFNQIARRVNSTDRIYADDIQEMKVMLEQLWEADNKILEKLASIN